MRNNTHHCLHCIHYDPLISGVENLEPEGMCHLYDTKLDSSGIHVYGHECCQHFMQNKTIDVKQAEYNEYKPFSFEYFVQVLKKLFT